MNARDVIHEFPDVTMCWMIWHRGEYLGELFASIRQLDEAKHTVQLVYDELRSSIELI